MKNLKNTELAWHEAHEINTCAFTIHKAPCSWWILYVHSSLEILVQLIDSSSFNQVPEKKKRLVPEGTSCKLNRILPQFTSKTSSYVVILKEKQDGGLYSRRAVLCDSLRGGSPKVPFIKFIIIIIIIFVSPVICGKPPLLLCSGRSNKSITLAPPGGILL